MKNDAFKVILKQREELLHALILARGVIDKMTVPSQFEDEKRTIQAAIKNSSPVS